MRKTRLVLAPALERADLNLSHCRSMRDKAILKPWEVHYRSTCQNTRWCIQKRNGDSLWTTPHLREMSACGIVLSPEALLHTVPQHTVTAPTQGEKPQRIHKFIMEPNLRKTIQRAPQTCMIRAKYKDCCQTSPDGDPTQEPGSPRTGKQTKVNQVDKDREKRQSRWLNS